MVPCILLIILEILVCKVIVTVKGAAKGGNCIFEMFFTFDTFITIIILDKYCIIAPKHCWYDCSKGLE